MPALHGGLLVLEHHLHERAEVGGHDSRIEVHRRAGGAVIDAPQPENAVNLEVVGELQRRVGLNEGDAVDGVTRLAAHHSGGVGELDRPGHRD